MTRALAHVEKILSIDPIPNADAIEVAQVLGWNVVVKKNDFKVGDLCVLFEIDSFLNSTDPRYSSFEDRFTNWGEKRGMRLKTIKLRGQISQGLILKIENFPEIKNPTEGQDVTDLLKIEKWESLAELMSNNGGRAQGSGRSFPSFIQKTDQTRIQSYTANLYRYLDEYFEETIKLDGSSMTVFGLNQKSKYFDIALDEQTKKIKGRWKKILHRIKKLFGLIHKPDFVTGVCSRNILLEQDSDNHFSTYAKNDNLVGKILASGNNYAIQGELIGPSIQDNHEKVTEFQFYVFNVFDIDNQRYLLPIEARAYCQQIGVSYVPVLNVAKKLRDYAVFDIEGNLDVKSTVDAILTYAEGPGMNPGVKREGVVFKSTTKDFSFKAISNSYLLKKEKGRTE